MPGMASVAVDDRIPISVHVICVRASVDVYVDKARRYVFRLYHIDVLRRISIADMGNSTISAYDVAVGEDTIRENDISLKNNHS